MLNFVYSVFTIDLDSFLSEEMLVTFMSRSSDASGGSFFGKYVDETLSTLPREIRREAEANIM